MLSNISSYYGFTKLLELFTADASKTGAAQEAMQNTVRRASKAITEQEARQILGVPENAAWEEISNVSVFCLLKQFICSKSEL